jgi:hypothetical protein
MSRPSVISCYLQDFKKWRDPDSNRGHHDFQLGLGMPWRVIGARKTAYLGPILQLHANLLPAECRERSARLSSNCRQQAL